MFYSVVDKLLRLFGRAPLIVPDDVSPIPALDEPRVPSPVPAAETWLGDLVARLAAGDKDAAAQLGDELGKRIDALVDAGHPRLAAEWLDKVATAAPPGPAADDVRARAARIYLERGESAQAAPHLEALLASPGHAARAHFQLGEREQRQGDRRRALRHFEAVLAIDVDFPNARARAEALRQSLGPAPAVAATVTVAGVDGQAATANARYRLVAELGRGASGAVYRARDVELERDVAIKLLHPHLGGDIGRFFAEARLAAALRHPSIVAVLDLDEEHRRIVMELAAGGTLRERLHAGHLAVEETLVHHADVLSALAAAHRRGVVHRDLKPANLLFRAPGAEIVLVDFGVAHLGAGGDAREAVGTLFYMAPEQRRGAAEPASDLWAAGVILHEMLTGRAPAGLAAEAPMLPPGLLPAPLAEPVAAHLAALTAMRPEQRPTAAAAARAALELVELARAGPDAARFAADLGELVR